MDEYWKDGTVSYELLVMVDSLLLKAFKRGGGGTNR